MKRSAHKKGTGRAGLRTCVHTEQDSQHPDQILQHPARTAVLALGTHLGGYTET